MKRNNVGKIRFGAALIVIVFISSVHATTYVDSSVGSSGSGASWASPYKTIQEAIDAASPIWILCTVPQQIWVKEGTYSLAGELTLNKIVSLYGGFPSAGSPAMVDRDPDAYPTIIDGNDSVRCMVVTAYSVIDGFTFQNGYSTGFGGAIQLDEIPTYNCSPGPVLRVTVRNCQFVDNHADFGGAIYEFRSNAHIQNCDFYGNQGRYGGAIRQLQTSTIIENCIFGNNIATNTTDYSGGAIIAETCKGSVTNCLFYDNMTAGSGGAIGYSNSSAPIITNCTFADNTAAGNGGAIYSTDSAPTIINSIFWYDHPNEIYIYGSGGAPNVSNSNIQGGWTGLGSNNTNANPVFVGGGDYHLTFLSPCIDTGSNSSAPTDDLDGNVRPHDGDGNGTATTDKGAYEYYASDVDLVVNSIVLDPVSPNIGELVTVTVTVSNQGSIAADGFYVDFYPDLTAPPILNQLGPEFQYFSSLAAGASAALVDTFTYTTGGAHSAYAQVDTTGLISETNETNNVFGPQTVNVSDVDLVIDSITYNPTSPQIGEIVTVTVAFSNQGTSDAGFFYVDWYSDLLIAPVTFDDGDAFQSFSSLAAGASNSMATTFTYTTEGTFSSYAQIDSFAQVAETDETNNVYGPRSIRVYDGELIDFNIIEDTSNASKWLGGDDRPNKRNVGVGQTMIFDHDTRVTSAGFRFSGEFDYYDNPEGTGHEVTLIMYVRESDGTLIYPGGLYLPSSFDGGWAMFSFGTGLWFDAGQEYIFTCHLSDGDINEYMTSVYGRTDDPWPVTDGYSASVASPANMGVWSNWGIHPWDFNLQMVGQYVEPYPGDLNDDRSVSIPDIRLLAQHWLDDDCIMLGWCEKTDVNWNSDVQLDDFATVSRYFGNTYHDYEDLNRAAIYGMYNQMSGSNIDGSDGNELNPGTYFVYRTSSLRYGKFIVENYDATTHALTIAWVTYNSDGTVYSSGTGLVIRGTYACDLDLGLETSTNRDFRWNQATSSVRYLDPTNGAVFDLMD